MEEIEHKSWFKRNWIWLLPTGGCLGVILVFFFFVGSLFFGISKILTDSDPYKIAMERTVSNKEVIEILGEPIESTSMMKGNINYNNGDGDAHIQIPIEGPKGKAWIIVEGSKIENADWIFDTMRVEFDSEEQVLNLLEIKEITD